MLKRFTYAILSILLALSNLVTVSADYKALTTEENVNVYTLPALSEEQISDQIKTYLMNKYDSVSKSVTVKLYHVVVSYEGQVTSESNVPVKFENALYLRNGLA